MTARGEQLPPLIVVAEFGDFERVVARASALRGTASTSLLQLDPDTLDVDALAPILGRVAPNEAVHVFHLVGELDAPVQPEPGAAETSDPKSYEQLISEVVATVGDHISRLHNALRDRYPLIDDRTWIVLGAGHQVSAYEQEVLGSWLGAKPDDGFVGALVVTASSGAALQHTNGEIDAQIADVIHAMSCSDLSSKLGPSGDAWAIGVGSVTYRSERHTAAAVLSIENELTRLIEARPRDSGYEQGLRWISELEIGPPRPGEQRPDAEANLLLTGPASGSLPAAPGIALRQLEADLEGLEPGLWAGFISTVVDATVAPRTSNRAPRSPLVVALDQLDLNLQLRGDELVEQVEAAARHHLGEQENLPNAGAWCEGVRAGIEESITSLTNANEWNHESTHLEESFERLRKAARWLPYSTSTLVRAALITMMALVIAYSFAPLPQLAARLFSKRLPWVGNDLESNARVWARITAVSVGCVLWVWWEAKWRRVRRLRRRYIQAADDHIRAVVHQHLMAGRVQLLRRLVTLVGQSTHSEGSLRSWVASASHAISELLAMSMVASSQDEELGSSEFAVALPSSAETNSVVEGIGDEERIVLTRAPSGIINKAQLNVRSDEIVAAIAKQIQDILPGEDIGLRARWKTGHIDDEAAYALRAALWSGMAHELGSHRDARSMRYLVASDEVGDLVEGLSEMPHLDGRSLSADPHFVANTWITRIVLPNAASANDPGRPLEASGHETTESDEQ